MKGRKSDAVFMFIGILLIAVFIVGMIVNNDPSAFERKYRYDYTVDQFKAFCANWYIPAGVIGIPLFLVFLIISLVREHRER